MSPYGSPDSSSLPRPHSQKGRILNRLLRDYPNWTSTAVVHRPDDGPQIIQAGTRIFELQREHGISIENRLRRVNGVVHSDYRFTPSCYADLTRIESADQSTMVSAPSDSTESLTQSQPKSLFQDFLLEDMHRDDN